MTHAEATISTKPVHLVDRDATGEFIVRHPAWLRDGVLVIAHPTDPKGLPVVAPVDGRYELSPTLGYDE